MTWYITGKILYRAQSWHNPARFAIGNTSEMGGRHKYALTVGEKSAGEATKRVSKLLKKIHSLRLDAAQVSRLPLRISKLGKNRYCVNFSIVKLSFAIALLAIFVGYKVLSNEESDTCVISSPDVVKRMFRTPEDCSMCSDVSDVVRTSNVTPEQFEQLYVSSAVPVIVTDAMKGWSATEMFNFNFFKEFYLNSSIGKRISSCYFFPYKSGFESLQHALRMSPAQAALLPGAEPWYVGWNTCYDEETQELRRHYSRPYFLPDGSESDMVDWIFMGGPGQGAHMHVDSVRYISWQAQLRGSKEWLLAPPPECLYQCAWINFTVNPGEILVVDTNRWYHKTNVVPGGISITIGAEFD